MNDEEQKTPTNAPEASPTTVPPAGNFGEDSSDDESNQIVFADNKKVIDRKELEKKRKKEAEENE